MLDRIRPFGRRVAEWPARVLARMGLTPNAITIVGLLLNVGVAAVLASGQPVLGGVLVLVANAFDMLDGALARVTGKASRFGAFLDSNIDRYAEALIFLGIGAWLFTLGDGSLLLAVYAATVGSMMVSYARARAEGLGVGGEIGLLPRPERLILLSIGLIFHGYLLAPVLWILAVFTNITAIQRILYVRSQLASGK